MKKTTKNFKVVEYRGCGIFYPVFFGTFKECQKFYNELPLDENGNSLDPDCRNYPDIFSGWSYDIEPDED